MPLGKQFRNTYWEDENGNTRYALDRGGDRPEYTSASAEVEKPTQGLLFDPYTGTGRKEDPSVPLETRQSVAAQSINSTDKELVDTLINSGVPIQTMRGINVDAQISSKPSVIAGGSGLYEPEENKLHVDSTSFRRRDNPNMAETVLTHELGHHLDPSIHFTQGSRSRFPNREPDFLAERGRAADPVSEGKADAFADRNTRFSDVYDHRLQNAVIGDMKFPLPPGYGTEAEEWKGGGSDRTYMRQALYAATRLLAGRSDSAGAELPNRSDIASKHYGTVYPAGKDQHSMDSALLGHYVHTNPGLADVLEGIHPEVGQAARDAHEHFKGIKPAKNTVLKHQRETAKKESGEQLKLDLEGI